MAKQAGIKSRLSFYPWNSLEAGIFMTSATQKRTDEKRRPQGRLFS